MASVKLGNYIPFTSTVSWKDQDAVYKIVTDRVRRESFIHQNGTGSSFDYLVVFYVKSIKVDGAQWTKLAGNILCDNFVGSRTRTNYGYTKTPVPANSTVTVESFDIYTVDLNFMPQGRHTVELTLGVYYGPRAPNSPVTDYQHDTTAFKDLVLADTLMVGAAPQTCELGISSVPGGAEIFLNESSTGKFTPATGYVTWTLSPGTYRLLLKLAGYEDKTDLFTLAANSSTAKSYTLVKIPPKEGYLKVTSSPSNLQIREGASVTDKFTPYTFTLPEGRYYISVNFNSVWADNRIGDVFQNATTTVNFDFSQGGVTKEQFATMFIQAVNNNALAPLVPLARWLYDNDPTGFHWAIYEAPMETRWLAFELALGIAGAEFIVIFLGDAIIAAGAAGIEAVAQALGGEHFTRIISKMLDTGRWTDALGTILSRIAEKVATAAGVDAIKLGLPKLTLWQLAKWLGTINGIGFAANWLAKEGVAETILFGVQNLITIGDYETALTTLEDSKTNFDTAMTSIKVFSYANLILKPLWDTSIDEYYRRYNSLKKQAEDKLAGVPPGVGVGQTMITLITLPADVHVKATFFEGDITTPKSWIVTQGEYNIIVSKTGYKEQKVYCYKMGRVEDVHNITLSEETVGPGPGEGTITISVYDYATGGALTANIYVDNVYIGWRASAVTDNYPAGAHTLRVEEEGYATQERVVTMAVGPNPDEVFQMKTTAGPNVAVLSISTTPGEAHVYINDVLQSYLTPQRFELASGTYSLKITKTGYDDVPDSVTVEAPNEYVKNYILHLTPVTPPPATTGTLSITTVPAGAHIYLNDVLQPFLSPQVYELAPGVYKILITKAGYIDVPETMNIAAGTAYPKTYVLTAGEVTPPPPPTETQGVVSVTTVPSGARIYINEILQPYLSPQRYDLEAGTYVFRITKSGYEDKSETVSVEAGKQYAKTYVLTSTTVTPAQTAWKVNVKSTPSGGKILIDGDVTGKYTPDYVILNPGTYTFRVEKTGYYPAEQVITLEAF